MCVCEREKELIRLFVENLVNYTPYICIERERVRARVRACVRAIERERERERDMLLIHLFMERLFNHTTLRVDTLLAQCRVPRAALLRCS